MSTQWNVTDVDAAIADAVPDRPCQVQGDSLVPVNTNFRNGAEEIRYLFGIS